MEDFDDIVDKYKSDFDNIENIILTIGKIISNDLAKSEMAMKITTIGIRITTSLTVLLPKILVEVDLFEDMKEIEKKIFLIDGIMLAIINIFQILNRTVKVMMESEEDDKIWENIMPIIRLFLSSMVDATTSGLKLKPGGSCFCF